MSETKRTKNIAFRLTDEDYAQIEKAAFSAGEDPNTWRRKLALAHPARATDSLRTTTCCREIALLQFLLGHGFKLLLGTNETTAGTWKKLTAQADQKSDVIVAELLSRRQ
jgi:hypothetical protein